MRSRLRKFFPLIAILLLAPWPVAYAYAHVNAEPHEDVVQVEASSPSLMPGWDAYGKAIGGVDTPGDLFYVDATESPVDILATLHITNTNELIRCYKYLILRVGIYVQSSADEWTAVTTGEGNQNSDIFITMRNGQVSFTLPSAAKYKVSIDGGCFYCFSTNVEGGSISPRFYLNVDQA